jgi:mannitol/fructose-specific phosphotransferase system IIA component (Ntr-type)
MGMMVDVSTLFQPKVLVFGGIFTVLAIIAKVVGCGFPALFANFNMMGALRIGMGMVPRGEVALIIAGIGMASGVLEPDFFSIAILMTLLTTLIPPPIISLIISSPIKGIRKETKEVESTTMEYTFASKDVREVVSEKIVEEFKSEGCFISRVYLDNIVYRITRNDISVSVQCSEDKIVISCDKADVVYVKNIVFEAFLEIHHMFEHLKDLSKPEEMKKELVKMDEPARTDLNILSILHKENIIIDLQGNTKEEIIKELIEKLDISDDERKAEIFNAVMEREALSSTGMEDGVAMPHGKINADINISVVMGLKKDGIDFNSLDGQPSQIFVLLVSPSSGNAPHIQALASISNILSNPDARKELIAAVSVDQAWDSLVRFSKK